MSLYRPDGSYYGPVPPWFSPPVGERFVQMVIPVRFPFGSTSAAVPLSSMNIKAITLCIGRYHNGEPKWRFLAQADVDTFEEQKAQEERW